MSDSITITANLAQAVPVYLDFLQRWSRGSALVSDQSLRRVLHRYEHLWLPLVSEWFQTDLEPPRDIYWIWHVHMLHPKLYLEYCMSRFGRILNHKIRLSDAEEKYASDRTRLIWRDKYPTEQFELDLDAINPGTYYQDGNNKLLPLIVNARKVMQFAHQVSLPHFRDVKFIIRALERYKQFLNLKKLRPYSRIAAPVDILLMWRLHALHPVDYYTEAYRPYKLYALNDSVDFDGRCLLDYGYNDSDWNALCHDRLLVPGSAYRGSPGFSNYVHKLPAEIANSNVADRCEIVLDNLSVSELWSRDKKLVVVVRLLGNSAFVGKEILRLEMTANKVVSSVGSSGTDGLVKFSFESKDNRGVEFNIYAVRGLCAACARGEVHLNTMLFNPRQPFESSCFTTKDFMYQIPKVSHVDPKVSFHCRVKAAPPPPHALSLDRRPLKARPLPKDLVPYVRDLPKWRAAIAKESLHGEGGLEFTVARHRSYERDESLSFGIEVVKQNDLDLGAVLIYHGDERLVAMAYSVGDETLASPAQLTSKCPVTLDPDEDEQAMLVCNHQGEWAVVRAQWQQHSADEGRTRVTIFYLNSHKNLTFSIRDDEMQTIKFGDVVIDMPSGRVTIDSRNPDIAEHLAIAFAVGVLYVSCQVRASILTSPPGKSPAGTAKGSLRSTKSGEYDLEAMNNSTTRSTGSATPRYNVRRRNKKNTRRRKMSASFTFLLATGLQIDVTLYGSTGRNQRPVSRGSLASLHMLYERSALTDGGTDEQTANNNNTPFYPPASQQTEDGNIYAYRQNYNSPAFNMIQPGNGRSYQGQTTPTTGQGRAKEDDTDSAQLYMDIRL